MSDSGRRDDSDRVESELTNAMKSTSIPADASYRSLSKGKVEAEGGDNEVTVTQYDPTVTLLSAKRFEDLGLRQELLDAVHAAKFVKPSKIQEKALPLILNDPNLIGQAKSGSGKTAAFVLGMLNRVDETVQQTQGLCICPTRELATQIYDVFKRMSGTIKFDIFLAVKEEDKDKLIQRKIAPHIIIGTPGRLLSLFKNRLIDLTRVRVFVCDEADVMMDKQGMADDTKRIKSWLPKNCQILLFSATFKDEVKAFALQIVSQPNIIMVKKEDLNVEAIKQFFIRVPGGANGGSNAKYGLLASLYSFLDIAQSIIFVETKSECDDLYRRLKHDGHEVSAIHSDLSTETRDRVMLNFRKGESKVLLATNVLSRGIDVIQVSLVVNYDLPYYDNERIHPDKETYLHRVGRSGRFGRKGTAITLCDDDKAVNDLQDIAREYSMSLDELPPNEDKLEAVLRPLLNQQKKEVEAHIQKYGMIIPLEEPGTAPPPPAAPDAPADTPSAQTWADEADNAPGWATEKPEHSRTSRHSKAERQPTRAYDQEQTFYQPPRQTRQPKQQQQYDNSQAYYEQPAQTEYYRDGGHHHQQQQQRTDDYYDGQQQRGYGGGSQRHKGQQQQQAQPQQQQYYDDSYHDNQQRAGKQQQQQSSYYDDNYEAPAPQQQQQRSSSSRQYDQQSSYRQQPRQYQ